MIQTDELKSSKGGLKLVHEGRSYFTSNNKGKIENGLKQMYLKCDECLTIMHCKLDIETNKFDLETLLVRNG